MKSHLHMDDTIVAIATPPGKGGVGVIRLSGPQARAAGLRVFRFGDQLKERKRVESHRMYFGWVTTGARCQETDNSKIDNGYFVYFKAPDSYTGEDVVELQLHGSPKGLTTILDLLLTPSIRLRKEHGGHLPLGRGRVRLAEPGEFTKRAFLNGKIDLAQAEAVADLIEAKTEAAGRLAERHLQGELSEEISAIRERLLELLSLIQGNVNFPEENIPEPKRRAVASNLQSLMKQIVDLTANSKHAWVYREGLNVAIVGFPNVGKSSLFNALLRSDRAIVSHISGTTRDTIEETIDIKGVPVVLTDTAGITESEDELEKMGVERSKNAIAESDLVVLVLDAQKEQCVSASEYSASKVRNVSFEDFFDAVDEEVRGVLAKRTIIKVFNKIDMTKKVVQGKWKWDEAWVSAKTGENIERFKEHLVKDYLDGGLERGNLLVTNVRQLRALQTAKEGIMDAIRALEDEFDLDTVSIDIERAASALGEILGLEVGDEVVEQIFGRFCIGK